MDISKYLFTGLDILIFYMVCRLFFDRRKEKTKICYILVAILFLSSLFVVQYIPNIFIKYILLTFIIGIMMNMVFKDNIASIFLVVILTYSLFFIIDYILLVFIGNYFNVNPFIKDTGNLFTLYILSRFLCVLLIFTISLKKDKIILENKYTYKFIFMSFLTIAGLVYFIIPKEYLISDRYVIPFILIFNILFIYYILKDFVKITNHLKIKNINEERAKNELKLWQSLKEKDRIQRKLMHDYSNTLLCVRGLLEKEDYDGAKNYVENISVKYKLSQSFVKTGNNLLDVLINSKYEYATENRIVLILKLDNLSDLSIEDDDLVVLLSNLMDNALEYVKRLDINKREIFLSMYRGEKLEILIRNPIENSLIIIDNRIESTKEDKENHGFGLLNVKEIIKKYNGEHYIDVDEGYFTHYIEL